MAFDHILWNDKLPIIWITNISNFPEKSASFRRSDTYTLTLTLTQTIQHIFFIQFFVSCSFPFLPFLSLLLFTAHFLLIRSHTFKQSKIFFNESYNIFHFYFVYHIFSVSVHSNCQAYWSCVSTLKTNCSLLAVDTLKKCGLSLYSKHQSTSYQLKSNIKWKTLQVVGIVARLLDDSISNCHTFQTTKSTGIPASGKCTPLCYKLI